MEETCPSLGHLKGVEVKIHVDAQTTPWFFRARNVPHALREQIEEALLNLVRSSWYHGTSKALRMGSPIVPVLKA